MRGRVRGWRWRRNPLRRRCDVVEMWTLLVVAVLVLTGAPLAGALAGLWAHDDARSVAAGLRAERHPVTAEVVGRPPAGTMPTADGGQVRLYRVDVRWTDDRGTTHTTRAGVPAGTRPGDTVRIWLDARGRGVPAPPGEAAVWQHTLTLGCATAGGTAAAILLGHAAVRRVALRHRLGEWDREWARTGPDWSKGKA
ncbi:hypothetical protein ACFWNK_13175 [Streptomyces sp. NPDC058417]|uniref:Rv1733c family protein n=1 Tax=unclassified Streptomyces TaxID=2593676 RepID=UPI00365C8144